MAQLCRLSEWGGCCLQWWRGSLCVPENSTLWIPSSRRAWSQPCPQGITFHPSLLNKCFQTSGTLARRSSLPQRGMPSNIPGRPVPTGWDSHSIAGGPLPPLKQTPTSRPPSSLASLRCPALPDLVNVAPPLPGVPCLPPIPPPPTALHWSPRVDRNTLKAGLGCIFLGQNMAYN